MARLKFTFTQTTTGGATVNSVTLYEVPYVIGIRELVKNGSFTTDSGWIEGVGWDIDVINNRAVCDGTQTANSSLQQTEIASIGNVYKIEFDLTVSAGYIQYVNLGGWLDNTDLTTSGTYTYYTGITTSTNNLGIASSI